MWLCSEPSGETWRLRLSFSGVLTKLANGLAIPVPVFALFYIDTILQLSFLLLPTLGGNMKMTGPLHWEIGRNFHGCCAAFLR
ncbi:uncharacterized protein LY89DRAFT_611630 [Mollisia scopiformis]|uniref:Uncharacterized protein n=1 Tax=Mollisia scopiformis TaxID=149040 RepID=A0A194XJ63_MOLSC|nr:uncharacterized protein LY89DRAFT_611630 [Mollisia scopiformis]KUJ19792.1 hypothetical protein LY89DRAFT_611630 [Mollisia scopiformis]